MPYRSLKAKFTSMIQAIKLYVATSSLGPKENLNLKCNSTNTPRNTSGIPAGCMRNDISKSPLSKYNMLRCKPQPGQSSPAYVFTGQLNKWFSSQSTIVEYIITDSGFLR